MTTVAVIADELRDHAGNLDECLKVIEQAQGASEHIELGDDAYGVLCQWIPPILAGRHADMNGLLTKAHHNLSTFAKLLRGAADSFESVDEFNSWDLTDASLDLDGRE